MIQRNHIPIHESNSQLNSPFQTLLHTIVPLNGMMLPPAQSPLPTVQTTVIFLDFILGLPLSFKRN